VPRPGRFAGVGHVEAEVDDQRDVYSEARKKNQRVTNNPPRALTNEVIDSEPAEQRHRQQHRGDKLGGTRRREEIEGQTANRPDETPSRET